MPLKINVSSLFFLEKHHIFFLIRYLKQTNVNFKKEMDIIVQ